MRVCVFEDQGTYSLAPLTLTRPAFDLRCGTQTLLERVQRFFPATELGVLIRPVLADLCKLHHPDLVINDPAWLTADLTLLVNARWLPLARPVLDLTTPQVGVKDGQLAYALLPPQRLINCYPATMDDCLTEWLHSLPRHEAGGWMLDYPWDLVQQNAGAIRRDFLALPARGRAVLPSGAAVVGPIEQLWIHPEARVEPGVVFDTTGGPVLVEPKAVVEAFTRIEGPCHVGSGTVLSGGRVRSSSFGPSCKIGCEVEMSIVQGYSNKPHDGYLGHSYVGEWVNLGSGTEISDLRNDYDVVRVMIGGDRVNTGQLKVGAFIGDHSKTGLNTLLNTGSVVGAFCNLLPTGTYLPRVVPSFSKVNHGELHEEGDLDTLLATASTVMRRRGCELTSVHTDFFRSLYDWTTIQRHQVIDESRFRQVRHSV